jgi:ankyrin repeat protein
MYASIKYGHPKALHLLIETGADIHASIERSQQLAVIEDEAECVTELIKAGADFNLPEKDCFYSGMTPICLAANAKSATILKLLIDQGANPHASIQRGWATGYTPLALLFFTDIFKFANAWDQNIDNVKAAIQILVDANVDLNAPFQFVKFKGYTPLQVCCLFNDNLSLAQCLITAGADFKNPILISQNTLFFELLMRHKIGVCELLINNGVSVNELLSANVAQELFAEDVIMLVESLITRANTQINPAIRLEDYQLLHKFLLLVKETRGLTHEEQQQLNLIATTISLLAPDAVMGELNLANKKRKFDDESVGTHTNTTVFFQKIEQTQASEPTDQKEDVQNSKRIKK